jgi:Transglycosylase SLT domain
MTASSKSAIGGAAAVAAAVAGSFVLALVAVVVAAGSAPPGFAAGVSSSEPTASSLALRDIPARYLALYQSAARRYGLDWAVLAGIGKVECDHGRDPDPSCTREEVLNGAGAGGPMQFITATWDRFGVDADGDGRVDRWDPADAIYSAANYLRASGAPSDYRDAILAYNRADWYLTEVMGWAARYRDRPARSGSVGSEVGGEADLMLAGETSSAVRFVAGERALLAPEDGHVALVPADAPPTVQAMIVAGNELQALPYGPDGHPDPRGAVDEDCSSTVNYVLYRSGVRPIGEVIKDNPLAQDYVHWGAPGPGRWVTIYATSEPSAHVFMVIVGIRLDTSHAGTDSGPNRGEDGPRWRLLDHIPTWARWSIRHPPGL